MVRLTLLSLMIVVLAGCAERDKAASQTGANSALEVMQTQVAKDRKVNQLSRPPKNDLKILENGEPNYVTVQHCLIAFKGSVYGMKTVTRTKKEAEALAKKVLEEARSGSREFDAIVREYTDDPGTANGIYRLANFGEDTFNNGIDPTRSIFGRDTMAPDFGNIGFKLEVGEFGMSTHDEEKSPFGFHIIKRLK